MGRTKAGVRGQHGDIAGPQAVDRFPIGIESDELPILGHIDLVAEQTWSRPCATVPLAPGADRPSRQLDGSAGCRAVRFATQHQSAGRHGVGHRTAAASAAADQGQRMVLSSPAKTCGMATPAKAEAAANPDGTLDELTTVV